MEIYRYKANSMLGYERVTVNDNYQLKASELKELPNPCYTPMKLDSAGNLVSATLDESNQAAQNYLKANDLVNGEVSQQQQIALLSTQIAKQEQSQTKSNALILSQIAQLKAQIQNTQGTENKEA